MATTFLSAAWRNLAMANYEVDPDLLTPYLPAHTRLDLWRGKCLVSLVGFMFENTRVLGIRVPGHVKFQEVNLRFYVIHTTPSGEERRGVVFIKEIVPRRAITFIANTLYRENYETMPMQHEWLEKGEALQVSYQWFKQRWHSFRVEGILPAASIATGSEAEFIAEHYWGYAHINRQFTTQYEVQHPRWEMFSVVEYSIDVDFALVYGATFGILSKLTPESVFLIKGSEVVVKSGGRLRKS